MKSSRYRLCICLLYTSNLTDINIPQNVMKIEDMTFADCTSLENIKLPEKLQEIGVKAFSNTDLKEIVIPDGTKAIDIKAFENCKNLKTVVLPKSVEYIAVDVYKRQEAG